MSTLSRAQIPLLPLQKLLSAVHRPQQVSRGVLCEITATQDVPKTDTRVRRDLDESHRRYQILLAGFRIALQVKERLVR
jgi:hypothetical protein